jgi:predicted DCC family thiol-disulfide oxidoreductase YuxK
MRVFFDASCPLCREEMTIIKANSNGSDIDLIDCSAADFFDAKASQQGITRAEMMRLIYAQGADGKWLIGVDVFVALYQRVGLTSVSAFWGNRYLSPVLRTLYPSIAKYRQGLSKLGANKVYNYFVARAAKKAVRQRCTDERCEL